jgi:hypothetical protein
VCVRVCVAKEETHVPMRYVSAPHHGLANIQRTPS